MENISKEELNKIAVDEGLRNAGGIIEQLFKMGGIVPIPKPFADDLIKALENKQTNLQYYADKLKFMVDNIYNK